MLLKEELEIWRKKDSMHSHLYEGIFILDFIKLFNVIEAGIEIGQNMKNWDAKYLTQISLINIVEKVLKEKI